MWLVVSFDLHSLTPEQRKDYRIFRRNVLEANGLMMLHESLYYRWCFTADRAQTLKRRIQSQLPSQGVILILTFTEAIGRNALCICEGNPDERAFVPTDPLLII